MCTAPFSLPRAGPGAVLGGSHAWPTWRAVLISVLQVRERGSGRQPDLRLLLGRGGAEAQAQLRLQLQSPPGGLAAGPGGGGGLREHWGKGSLKWVGGVRLEQPSPSLFQVKLCSVGGGEMQPSGD